MQVEKTLQKGALEQYLAGGFNVDAIVTQVVRPGGINSWASNLSQACSGPGLVLQRCKSGLHCPISSGLA